MPRRVTPSARALSARDAFASAIDTFNRRVHSGQRGKLLRPQCLVEMTASAWARVSVNRRRMSRHLRIGIAQRRRSRKRHSGMGRGNVPSNSIGFRVADDKGARRGGSRHTVTGFPSHPAARMCARGARLIIGHRKLRRQAGAISNDSVLGVRCDAECARHRSGGMDALEAADTEVPAFGLRGLADAGTLRADMPSTAAPQQQSMVGLAMMTRQHAANVSDARCTGDRSVVGRSFYYHDEWRCA